MAICEPCLYFIFEAIALENTIASMAGMVCAILPIMVGVAAAFMIFIGIFISQGDFGMEKSPDLGQSIC